MDKSKARRPKLFSFTQAQRAHLNKARTSSRGGECEVESNMLSFGRKFVFPFIDKMLEAKFPLETKNLRDVLKKARDDRFLLPSQYRLARAYSHILLKEFKRIHNIPSDAPLLSTRD